MIAAGDLCRLAAGVPLAIANGCFDLGLSRGHLSLLTACIWHRPLQTLNLVVLVNSDESVAALKGRDRPIQPDIERAARVAMVPGVAAACIVDDLDMTLWLARLRPRAYVTSRRREEMHPGELAELDRLGTQVFRIRVDCPSTSDVLAGVGR